MGRMDRSSLAERACTLRFQRSCRAARLGPAGSIHSIHAPRTPRPVEGVLGKRRAGIACTFQQYGSVFRFRYPGWRGSGSLRPAGTTFNLRIGRCRRGCGYLDALLSIPFRALLAGLLREGPVDVRTSRCPLSSRTGHDCDRHSRIVGLFFAPRDPPRPAASTSDARASQQSTGKVRKTGASGANRSLCPSSAGVQIRLGQRFSGASTIAQASPCARPPRAAWQ